MKLPRSKVRWSVAGLLLVLFVALLAWSRRSAPLEQRIARYRAAGEPTSLAELQAWYDSVPDSENAVPALLKAAGAWHRIYDTNLPTGNYGTVYPKLGEAWPAAMVNAARAELAGNAAPLAQIYAALQRPRSRYQVNLETGTSASLMITDRLCEDLGLEARWAAAEVGGPERAANALLAMLRLARTQEEEPLLGSYLTRLAVNLTAQKTAACVLSRTALSEARLRELQQAFVMAESTNHLRRVLIGVRCQVLAELNRPSPGIFDPFNLRQRSPQFMDRFYERSGIKRADIAQTLDRLDALTVISTRSRSEMPSQQWRVEAQIRGQSRWSLGFHPLSFRTTLIYEPVLFWELHAVAQLRCAQAAMAIERWQLAHGGTLPGSLGELVPAYLAAVPEDPVTGKPVDYRVWSSAPGFVVYGRDENSTVAR